MNPFDKIGAASLSGMNAQAQRLQITSENIANVDTHGYRRKLVTFDAVFDRTTDQSKVEVSDVMLDSSDLEQTYDPTHPFADQDGYVDGSNVNIMTEFANAREASRSYDAGLEVFRQARGMYASLIELLRR